MTSCSLINTSQRLAHETGGQHPTGCLTQPKLQYSCLPESAGGTTHALVVLPFICERITKEYCISQS